MLNRSNFQFIWPWEEWAYVLDLPKWAPKRVFVQEVLQREVRLSYWDKIKQVTLVLFRFIYSVKFFFFPRPLLLVCVVSLVMGFGIGYLLGVNNWLCSSFRSGKEYTFEWF